MHVFDWFFADDRRAFASLVIFLVVIAAVLLLRDLQQSRRAQQGTRDRKLARRISNILSQ